MKRILIVTFAFCLVHASGISQIILPKLFSDNMVLQRGIKIPIWGNAKPGAILTASLASQKIIGVANARGEWKIYFAKINAGGPYTLKIAEQGKPITAISFKGILIGDVWLASGQSNMEWQVQQSLNAQYEIKKANFPNVRFLFVEHEKKLQPQSDITTEGWKLCDTNNVRKFSAVAYFFARKIQQDQNVPIGIIQSTWGGTPVNCWTSREMLLSSPLTKLKILANDSLTIAHFVKDSLDLIRFWDIVYHPQNNADKIVPLYEYNDSKWDEIEMPRLVKDFGIGNYEGMMWLRKKIVLPESFTGKDLSLNLGHPEMNYSLYFNGVEICTTIWNANPKQSYTIPFNIIKQGDNVISLRMAMLWTGGGLNPPAENIYISNGESKISLAGKWLYKKDLESTIPKIYNYHYYPALLYNAMINPFIPYGIKGFLWYQGEADEADAYNYRTTFPMMIKDWRQRWKQGNLPFLYVQLANFRKANEQPAESQWAELREAQTMALSQPNTGMACTIDIGEAGSIHPLNKQEVGYRLALLANRVVYKKNIVASGPIYHSYTIEGNNIRISFENIGTGLKTNDEKNITGFAIAGADKHFYWANALVKGNEIIIHSDKVTEPKAVRYAWADNPECNLVNSAGLPAVPFRTDGWKGITQN
jgi:sialate O-acetylesterase